MQSTLYSFHSFIDIMAPILLLIPFFMVAAASNHETAPAQVYWNKALPNTPMPGAIKDFLHPAAIKGNNIGIKLTAMKEEDMLLGTKVNLHFMRTTAGLSPTFLSRQAADSIPFSSTKLPSILAHFSLEPNSEKAESIKETLAECEITNIEENTKKCATSLESMIEYVTTSLGTHNVQALSTVMSKEDTTRQQYTIIPSGMKKLSGSNFVACHARRYPYAVFYCHSARDITAYQTSMVGKDGTVVKAVALCHNQIARLNPKVYSVGFKFTAGKDHACFFLPQDHIVWRANN